MPRRGRNWAASKTCTGSRRTRARAWRVSSASRWSRPGRRAPSRRAKQIGKNAIVDAIGLCHRQPECGGIDRAVPWHERARVWCATDAVADAVREWHADTGPGPLLLLPLDAVGVSARVDEGDLVEQLEVAPEAAGWARILLERVRSLDDGSFIDKRGAVWLPGPSAGPGPLRRRAESDAAPELDAADESRRAAAAATEIARAGCTRGSRGRFRSDASRRITWNDCPRGLGELETWHARSERDCTIRAHSRRNGQPDRDARIARGAIATPIKPRTRPPVTPRATTNSARTPGREARMDAARDRAPTSGGAGPGTGRLSGPDRRQRLKTTRICHQPEPR